MYMYMHVHVYPLKITQLYSKCKLYTCTLSCMHASNKYRGVSLCKCAVYDTFKLSLLVGIWDVS